MFSDFNIMMCDKYFFQRLIFVPAMIFTHAKQEGEHELVSLEQGTTDVWVETESVVLVDVHNPLLDRVWKQQK